MERRIHLAIALSLIGVIAGGCETTPPTPAARDEVSLARLGDETKFCKADQAECIVEILAEIVTLPGGDKRCVISNPYRTIDIEEGASMPLTWQFDSSTSLQVDFRFHAQNGVKFRPHPKNEPGSDFFGEGHKGGNMRTFQWKNRHARQTAVFYDLNVDWFENGVKKDKCQGKDPLIVNR